MMSLSTKICTLLILLFGASGIAMSSAEIGQRAPDFVLRSIDGANLRLSEYRSEVVVLNF